ncbi:MAG TPA: serine/threonine-protein kinase [Ktedonobacterales bacterium]|jgi:serine/threonine-protein kinase
MAAIEDRRTRTAPTHSLIAQRYELGAPLAHGGMATLWHGWDRRLCRPVAVKTLRDDDLHDESLRTRLRREALVSAALSHPHIVEVHDVVEEDERLYLIMELVEGEDLKRRIAQRGALDPLDALEIAQQMCLALEAAHLRGVIHRDVKPHNILLSTGRHAKLTDFGLALSPLDTTPEQSEVVFGTPEYMAPEQAMGERISAATDLYGLGVTLYEALSGDAPFLTPSAEETMKRHISEPITPLRRLRPELPRSIEAVVMRALEKEPERRYPAAQHMEQALRQAAYDARDVRSVFAAPAWPTPAKATPVTGATQRAARASHHAPALPDAFWVRLMWVIFALNIMLAISLLCAFVLHLAM